MLLPQLPQHPHFVNGFGDDCAIVDIGGSAQLVTKIDRAASPMATRKGWAGYDMWGRLAATTTCSDILAAGAHPVAIMIALVLPPEFAVDDAADIVLGCADECAAHGVAFVGGDTKEGPHAEVISAGFGLATIGETLGRAGGVPGDLLVVAGRLGGYLGAYLRMLETEHEREGPRWQSWLDYVTRPTARWVEAERLRPRRLVKSAMDCSDGLYDAVDTLSGQHGARLYEENLPFHPFALDTAKALNLRAASLAFGVGDWNILYVVPAGRREEVEYLGRTLALTVIGELTSQGDPLTMIDDRGRERRLRRVVNEHFVARQEDEEGDAFLEQVRAAPYA